MTRKARLTLIFKETEKEPYLRDISNLLYDFELAYDLSVLSAEEQYRQYRISRFFFFRKPLLLEPQHRLRAVRIVKESPLLVEVVIPSLGALWVLLQIIEKIQDWDLNRKKLELEVQKLSREEEHERRRVIDLHVAAFSKHFAERDAEKISRQVIDRLAKNPNRLVDLELELVEDKYSDGKENSKV